MICEFSLYHKNDTKIQSFIQFYIYYTHKTLVLIIPWNKVCRQQKTSVKYQSYISTFLSFIRRYPTMSNHIPCKFTYRGIKWWVFDPNLRLFDSNTTSVKCKQDTTLYNHALFCIKYIQSWLELDLYLFKFD